MTLYAGSRLGPYEILSPLGAWISFDVSPDGKRLLAIVPKIVADELPLEVVVNWTASLKN